MSYFDVGSILWIIFETTIVRISMNKGGVYDDVFDKIFNCQFT